MTNLIRRREFMAALGGAAFPILAIRDARAQQPAMPVIGFLHSGAPIANLLAAFHKGLGETGYAEGRNVAIEYRFANNDSDRLRDLAVDLVRRRVSVIATPGG